MSIFSCGYGDRKKRHKSSNFQMYKIDTKIINESFEEVFNKLDLAAKINIALGFVFRNIETGEYRYFYDQENNTSFEKALSLCIKANWITIQQKLVLWRNVPKSTKWRFRLITSVSIFDDLLKYIPTGVPSLF